jgi:hypothetical protein
MALPGRGTRRIVVDGVPYHWRVAYDRLHWDKGYLSGGRIVVQATEPPGQLLLAEFMGSRRANDALNNPFTPGFARMRILAGLARAWRPGERILGTEEANSKDRYSAIWSHAHTGVRGIELWRLVRERQRNRRLGAHAAVVTGLRDRTSPYTRERLPQNRFSKVLPAASSVSAMGPSLFGSPHALNSAFFD